MKLQCRHPFSQCVLQVESIRLLVGNAVDLHLQNDNSHNKQFQTYKDRLTFNFEHGIR